MHLTCIYTSKQENKNKKVHHLFPMRLPNPYIDKWIETLFNCMQINYDDLK